jgi:membrane protease YdiL (CAAX protease family)
MMSARWIGVLLVVLIALVLPIHGVRFYRRLKARVTDHPGARTRGYLSILIKEWALTLAVAGWALLAHPDESARLTLLWRPFGAAGIDREPPWLPSIMVGVFVGAMIGLFAPLLVPTMRRRIIAAMSAISAILPHTRRERALFALVALSAGLCEEIIFRGFLLAFLPQLIRGLPAGGAILVSSGLFGLGHLYQGVKGIVGTAILGLLFGGLVVATGSLLLPIVAHSLIDLRILLLPSPQSPRSAEPESPTGERA